MWSVIYPDGNAVTNEDVNWIDISDRVTFNGYVFDILRKPAVEIRIRLFIGDNLHRLRSPQPVKFFHYFRARSNMFAEGQSEILYEAVGYCFAGGRIVLEVASGMGVTRAELGEQFTFEEVML